MKILKQTILLIILSSVIYIIYTDYNSFYSKTVSYFANKINKHYNVPASDKDLSTIFNIDPNDKEVKSTKASAPGILLVSDNFLTNNFDKINLSSKKVIDITNKYRSENGDLVSLTENTKLDFSAEKKLQDMFVKNYFEHISPSGVGVGDLGNQVGYEYIIIGENLAMGNFKDDKSLVDAWMASPGHRANILNKKYTEIGIAVGKGVYNGNNVWMSVQHFGLPKSACPSIDEVLRGIIEIDQRQIKNMENDLSKRRTMIESGALFEGFTTNDQINKYNTLVVDYNKIVTGIKEKINKYNEEVKAFNNCIKEAN